MVLYDVRGPRVSGRLRAAGDVDRARPTGAVEVGFFVQGSFCTIEGDIGGPFTAAIDDGEFTVRITAIDPTVTLEGTFTSSTRASGTARFSAGQCSGSASTSWTAAKQ